MREFGAGVFAYVALQLLPLTFLITDLLTLAADGEKCLQNLDFRKRSAQFLCQLVLPIKQMSYFGHRPSDHEERGKAD